MDILSVEKVKRLMKMIEYFDIALFSAHRSYTVMIPPMYSLSFFRFFDDTLREDNEVRVSLSWTGAYIFSFKSWLLLIFTPHTDRLTNCHIYYRNRRMEMKMVNAALHATRTMRL